MSNWKRRTALLLAGCLTMMGFAGCAKTEEPEMDKRVVVDTCRVDVGSVELKNTYIGSAAAIETVYVVPMVSGTVKEVKVHVGDHVKEGDLLCRFDDTAAQFSMASAWAAYNSVQAQADSTLGSSWDMTAAQTQNSIDTVMDQISQLNDSRKQLEQQEQTVKSMLEAAQLGMNQTNAAYSAMMSRQAAASSVWDQVRFAADDAQVQSILTSASSYAGLTMPLTKAEVLAANPISLAAAETANAQIMSLGMEVSSDEYAQEISNILTNASAMGMLEAGAAFRSVTDVQSVLAVRDQMDSVKQAANTALGGYESALAAYQSVDNGMIQLDSSIAAAQKGLDTALDMRDRTQNEVRSSTENTLRQSLAQAQVGVNSAAYQVGLYQVKSPIDGVVQSVAVTEKNMFATGQPAFTITNESAKTVTFYVTEAAAQQMLPGQEVEVYHKDRTYYGNVTEIGSSVDMQRGLFRVKATVAGAGEISGGISVKLATVAARESTQLVVPCDAVRYYGGRSYVFLNDNGIARQVEVTTGIHDEANVVILDGLQPGQEIVTTWSANLIEGAELVIPAADGTRGDAA